MSVHKALLFGRAQGEEEGDFFARGVFRFGAGAWFAFAIGNPFLEGGNREAIFYERTHIVLERAVVRKGFYAWIRPWVSHDRGFVG